MDVESLSFVLCYNFWSVMLNDISFSDGPLDFGKTMTQEWINRQQWTLEERLRIYIDKRFLNKLCIRRLGLNCKKLKYKYFIKSTKNSIISFHLSVKCQFLEHATSCIVWALYPEAVGAAWWRGGSPAQTPSRSTRLGHARPRSRTEPPTSGPGRSGRWPPARTLA